MKNLGIIEVSGAITANKLVANGLTIWNRYEISVDLNIDSNSFNAWSNILHFRVDGNQDFVGVGDRLPAIYQWPSSNKWHLCNNVGFDTTYCYDPDNMPVNTWFNLKFRQVSLMLFKL